MSNYKKMIRLFEDVKDDLSADDLHYVLQLIQEYDSCRGPGEADEIERTIIDFCTNKMQKNTVENA